jgi:hypothetical protein
MDDMQEACKEREEMKVWHLDSNTLVDDNGMDHKLGTKGTKKTDSCKRNGERRRSYRQGRK